MKKSFRHAYWFFASIFKRYGTIIIVSTIIGAIAMLNAPKIIELLPQSQTTYIGRAGSYSLSQLPIDIQKKISNGLTQIDESGKPVPDLAESWSIQESGRIYQFMLNPEKKWQDGKPVTVQDIDISLSDVEIEKEGDHKLTFVLKDPFSPFPAIVSQPLFRKVVDRYFLFFKRTKIIGTNDFSITKIKTQSNIITQLILRSSDQKLIYRFYPTEEDAITAYKLGKVDRLEDISNPKDIGSWQNTSVNKIPHQDQFLAIFLNTADPNLSDKSTRQALAYAIEDKTDEEERTVSPINPESWAYNPQVKPYNYNPQTAKDLLSKANGEDDDGNFQIELTLTTTQAFIDQAEAIIRSWEAVGVKTNLKIVNFPDTNDYQVLLIGQKIPKDPDQYTFWHSTQATNFTRYNSPRVDKLLEDGRKTIDEDERTLIYQDFQRFLTEDSPVIFLHSLSTYNIQRR